MQPQQPPASKPPLGAITTDQIQKCLEDNKNLIMAILERQKLGRFQECAQRFYYSEECKLGNFQPVTDPTQPEWTTKYQAVLQKNLMYLAAIADAQPPTPNPSQVMQTPPNSIPQASSFMQQPQQKLPFQVNSIYTQDQQQQLLLRQQQQFQAQVGIRAGVQNGLFPGTRQGDSEVAYGGDARGLFFDNGNFRD